MSHVRLDMEDDRIYGIYMLNNLYGAGYLGTGYEQAAKRIRDLVAEADVRELTVIGRGAAQIGSRLEDACTIHLDL